ncbi:MAG: hypothetical protein Q4B26_05530 [Eubacteriales bacterium]|nr:hypothetical protein [Eubacteriales bacterium]
MIGTIAFFILILAALFGIQIAAENSDNDDLKFSNAVLMATLIAVETTYIFLDWGWLK